MICLVSLHRLIAFLSFNINSRKSEGSVFASSPAMDIEKEKPDVEKIKNGDNHGHDRKQLLCPDDHQHDHEEVPSPKHTTEEDGQDLAPVNSPSKAEAEVFNHDNYIETEPQNEEEESSPMPPDLSKVSEEIDAYVASLSTAKANHTDIHPDVPICVEQFAVLVEARIENFEASEPPVKWSQLSVEKSAPFLEAVFRISHLSTWLGKFSCDYRYAYTINRIGGVVQRAMSYLEEQFKLLVEDCNKILVFPQDHSSSEAPANKDDDSKQPSTTNQDATVPESDPPEEGITFPGYSEDILFNLSGLAKLMCDQGYETECCQVYFVARRNALEESLRKLGFQKHSIDDVQRMQWETLTSEIDVWIVALKQCTTILFPSERKLADAVFGDHQSIATSLFNSLSRGALMELFNLSEAVAMTKRAPEKLFKFLDMYEALRDIAPALDDLLDRSCAEEIKSEASLIRSRLGEAMIIVFSELESSIKADAGKTPVPGGAVHPLTRYIMNYLPYACNYKETLEQVFRAHQKIERADSGTGSEFDYNSQGQGHQNSEAPKTQSSPFQIQLFRLMDLLDVNLEAKSKLYRDASLSSIFMMNNGRYILQKTRGCAEINGLMGDSWCRKRSSDLRQYHKNYQRETWGKPLNCLMNHEGLHVNGKVVKPVLKERFKSFNAMFDEIHRTQSTWVVCDEQLQSELRVSVSNMVIPAYRAFLARYAQTLTPGRQTEKYVKLQPEDIETYIDELFDGNATPSGRKKL